MKTTEKATIGQYLYATGGIALIGVIYLAVKFLLSAIF